MKPAELAKKFDRKILEEALKIAQVKEKEQDEEDIFIKNLLEIIPTNPILKYNFEFAMLKTLNDNIKDKKLMSDLIKNFISIQEVYDEVQRLRKEFHKNKGKNESI